MVISNTVWVGERLPCLTYGMRGMVTASIEVRRAGAHEGRRAGGRSYAHTHTHSHTTTQAHARGHENGNTRTRTPTHAYLQVSGPARDVHSGNDGGVFSEPMADLFKLLASLTESPAAAQKPRAADSSAPSSGPSGGSGGAGSRPGSALGMRAAVGARGAGNGVAAGFAAGAGSPGSDGSGASAASAVSIAGGRVAPPPPLAAANAAAAASSASVGPLSPGRGPAEEVDCDCGRGGGAMGTPISIPGFYDGVRPRLIDLAWAGLEDCDEFKLDSYQ